MYSKPHPEYIQYPYHICFKHILAVISHMCGVVLAQKIVDQARKCIWLGLDADGLISVLHHMMVTSC